MPDPQPFSIQIPHPLQPPTSSRGPPIPSHPSARDLPSLNSPLSPHHPVRHPPRIVQLRVHRLQPSLRPHPSTGTQQHANSQYNHRLQQSHGVFVFGFVVSLRPAQGITSPSQVPLHYDTPTLMALPKCRLVCSGTIQNQSPRHSSSLSNTPEALRATPLSMARRMLHPSP